MVMIIARLVGLKVKSTSTQGIFDQTNRDSDSVNVLEVRALKRVHGNVHVYIITR